MCKVLWGVSGLVGRRGQLWSFTSSHFIRKASEVTHPLRALGMSIVVPVSKSPYFTGTHLNWHTEILNKKHCAQMQQGRATMTAPSLSNLFLPAPTAIMSKPPLFPSGSLPQPRNPSPCLLHL